MSIETALPKQQQSFEVTKTLKIVVECISGDLSELCKLALQDSAVPSVSSSGELSLCISAEIWVHGDGAVLAPPTFLPFIDVPTEQVHGHAASLSASFSSQPQRKWREFPLDLQLRIADLPLDSKLVVSLFAMTGAFSTKMVACTVMPLFRLSKNQGDGQLRLRTGRAHAFLWAGTEPDLCGRTPSHMPGRKAASMAEHIEEKLSSKSVPHSPLLDVHCRALVDNLKSSSQQTQAHLTLCVGETDGADEDGSLATMLAKKNIIYSESSVEGEAMPVATENFFSFPFIEDFIDQPTPAEHKHRAMSRCACSLAASLHSSVCILTQQRSSVVTADRTLKPDSQVYKDNHNNLQYFSHFTRTLQELLKIFTALNSPPSVEPSVEQRQMLWTYRFSLLNMERAMKRLLLWFDDSSCADPTESQLVKDLIAEWERQVALTPYDVLPLLSQSFRNPVLRKFAVQILKKNEQGHDESMQQMLLQLVQALRYEEQINSSPLAELLVKRSQRHEATAYALNWFLTAEVRTDPRNMKFNTMTGRLMQALTTKQKASLTLQNDMVDELVVIASEVKSLPSKQRVAALREMLQKSKFPFSKFSDMIPLPIDPQLKAKCLEIERSEVYTSSQVPVGLTFVLEDGSRYSAILKTGDDVRQDQLILQTICIMDGILKRYGVDMRLTPYRALAVSKTAGFVQKVPDCERMSVILSKYSGSIINFLKEQPPPTRDVGSSGEKEKGGRREMANKYGINAEVYYNFVYSCAGYCVITYILGIGDRHLDNILIQRNGKLFHIDFGFILGADPKLMPPPMRIVQPMIDAMGGVRGEEWATFLDLCVEMFNRLRKHADFFVSLFALMKHGGIIGISGGDGNESFSEAKISFLWNRFHVDLDDERAGQKIRALIQESAKALAPKIFEQFHKIAQWLHQ